jgi:hypothetical protein
MEDPEYAFSDDIVAAVDSGRKIDAIKMLREQTGLGLKDAKHAIDALARERRGQPGAAAGMPEAGGASGLIKLLVVIAVLLAGYSYFFMD